LNNLQSIEIFSLWCWPSHATCNRRKGCARHWVWQGQATHVLPPILLRQAGRTHLVLLKFGPRLKPIGFISLA